jgi:hypothetical protein
VKVSEVSRRWGKGVEWSDGLKDVEVEILMIVIPTEGTSVLAPMENMVKS